MTFKRFDNQDLFNQKIFDGISLFCGAGFSSEAEDINGQKFPLGKKLLEEIKSKFPEKIYKQTKLDRAASILESGLDKSNFLQFLTSRLTVGEYDVRYNTLSMLKIKNIFTTNIDDLFFKIFDINNKENENALFINMTSLNGISSDFHAINYSPLHGCVKYPEKGYKFSVQNIATAYTHNGQTDWYDFKSAITKEPILVWGWNFEDQDVLSAMFESSLEKNTHRWAILYKPTDDIVEWVASQGFHVIISSTDEMLEYIAELVKIRLSYLDNEEAVVQKNNMQEYEPPSREELLSIPFERFFTEYSPDWTHIYSGNIAKTQWYSRLENDIASGRNIIVYGIPGCGKTTLLRQLLLGYKSKKNKHFLESPLKDKAEVYVKQLASEKSILFVDDCFRDTDAIIALFGATNIQVVGFSRDYNYERQNFRLDKFDYIKRDITMLTENDVVAIFETVPNSIKKSYVSPYALNDLTMVTLFPNIVKSSGNFKFIRNFYKQDPVAAEVFVLICYIHACGVPASFDMIYSFLGDDQYDYDAMYHIIARAGGLINNYNNESLLTYSLNINQDYYNCRSRFLAEKILESTFLREPIFGDMLLKFASRVPVFKICNYDFFRRTGYDADWAFKAFAVKERNGNAEKFKDNDRGKKYYTICAENDDSEYIYQQAALYFSKMKCYKIAYEWIDKAKNIAHYDRFSINNTEAQIKFDANFGLDDDHDELVKSLDIMRESCESDKRKHIHFCSFAEYAVRFHERYKNDSLEYLKKAQKYIADALEGNSSQRIARNTRRRLYNISRKISCLI
jgi:hypothetical protein